MDPSQWSVLAICRRLLRPRLAAAPREPEGHKDDRQPLRAADRAHDRPTGRDIHRKGPIRQRREPADYKRHRPIRSPIHMDLRSSGPTPVLSLASGQSATRYFRVTAPESAEGEVETLTAQLTSAGTDDSGDVIASATVSVPGPIIVSARSPAVVVRAARPRLKWPLPVTCLKPWW